MNFKINIIFFFSVAINFIALGADLFKLSPRRHNQLKTADVYCLLSSRRQEQVEIEQNLGLKLIEAISSNDIKLVREAIEEGADVNYYNYYESLTPLSLAALKGNLDIIKFLLHQGADIDGYKNGNNPLMNAVIGGHIEVINFLINNFVGINKRYTESRDYIFGEINKINAKEELSQADRDEISKLKEVLKLLNNATKIQNKFLRNQKHELKNSPGKIKNIIAEYCGITYPN